MIHSSDVLQSLLRRWWVLIIGLVWGGVLGGLASLLMTPTYQADIYLMVVTRSQEVENTAAFDYTQAYSRLPTVPAVVAPVLDEYGIAPTSQAIEEVVGVEVPMNTPVFQIIVNTDDPGEAASLANDVGEQVRDFVADRLAPGTGYRAVVVAEATTPQQPVSPDWVLNIAVGAALGLMLSIAAALIWDDLWRGRKKRNNPEASPSAELNGSPYEKSRGREALYLENNDRRTLMGTEAHPYKYPGPSERKPNYYIAKLATFVMTAALIWHNLRRNKGASEEPVEEPS